MSFLLGDHEEEQLIVSSDVYQASNSLDNNEHVKNGWSGWKGSFLLDHQI